MPDSAECPTPTKRTFRSKAEAARWWRRAYYAHGKDRLYPYLCPCGAHWHLTHQTPQEQAEISARIARAGEGEMADA